MKAMGCAALMGLLCVAGAQADGASDVRVSHFSGEPVPRFETLRYAAANGRTGPSRDHRIVWRYERKGLPLLIIKESQNWRRVRDPDGDEVWIHARMLTKGETVLVQSPATLTRKPAADARTVAHVEGGVLADALTCVERHCRVSVGGHKGWIAKTALWGVNTTEAGL